MKDLFLYSEVIENMINKLVLSSLVFGFGFGLTGVANAATVVTGSFDNFLRPDAKVDWSFTLDDAYSSAFIDQGDLNATNDYTYEYYSLDNGLVFYSGFEAGTLYHFDETTNSEVSYFLPVIGEGTGSFNSFSTNYYRILDYLGEVIYEQIYLADNLNQTFGNEYFNFYYSNYAEGYGQLSNNFNNYPQGVAQFSGNTINNNTADYAVDYVNYYDSETVSGLIRAYTNQKYNLDSNQYLLSDIVNVNDYILLNSGQSLQEVKTTYSPSGQDNTTANYRFVPSNIVVDPEDPDPQPVSTPEPGSLLALAGISLLAFGFKKAQRA